ncbi:hypothetical protein LEA_15606 [human gut metagenome]
MNHLFPTGTADTENLPLAASPVYFDIKSSDRHCHRFYNGGHKMGIQSIDAEDDQFAYRYDTQLLIERRDRDLDEDEISDYITEHFEGNSLIAAGDEDLIKIHFHTNEPWKILEYCSSVGEIFDIVVEDMIRQSNGLQG